MQNDKKNQQKSKTAKGELRYNKRPICACSGRDRLQQLYDPDRDKPGLKN